MAFDARGGGSGAASDSRSHARVRGERLLFGVSGKLYNSDVLFYDRKTESLWSQLKMEAVTGSMAGTRLKLLPLEHTTWGDWRKRHPTTTVLSLETGFTRDYARNPYRGYENNPSLMFPVAQSARVIDSSGRPIPSVTAYWFAWVAFHPETEVFGDSSP